jgi:hypothetical protein
MIFEEHVVAMLRSSQAHRLLFKLVCDVEQTCKSRQFKVCWWVVPDYIAVALDIHLALTPAGCDETKQQQMDLCEILLCQPQQRSHRKLHIRILQRSHVTLCAGIRPSIELLENSAVK